MNSYGHIEKKVILQEELIGIGSNGDLKVSRGLPQTEKHGKRSMRQKVWEPLFYFIPYGSKSSSVCGALSTNMLRS
ncbi:hypothetical protein TNCV_3867641 [Trichonephila clavipes]|nr:hypothetical protein TNCV_3867641 [Trichonephila clavipes]